MALKSLKDWCKENKKLSLLEEWHATKNRDIDADSVSYGKDLKVWWICPKGHEWQASIRHRTYDNSGCPYCAGNTFLKGLNDLETLNPELSKEWHPTKNGNMKPADICNGSAKKVWWICSKGHEWQASVRGRTVRHTGCPYCSNSQVLTGYNDLKTLYPQVAHEWHPVKNGDLHSCDVLAGSGKKAWWMCDKGHEWEAVINCRTSRGYGCPYCSGRNVIIGINDLNTMYPDVIKEWHSTKNGELNPGELHVGSHKKVWWKCSEGHEWQATIKDRTLRKRGCPYCSGRVVTPGVNDIVTLRPDIVKEWDYDKNNKVKPADFTCGSDYKAWWKCSAGHHWQATICCRISQQTGCPYCAGKRVLKGFNDLATINPSLAKEWNKEKNGNVTPADVTSGSNQKVWWRCEKGHEWRTSVGERSLGTNCPYCANRKVLVGFNDLQTVMPALANEWNYEKNGDLKPADVVYGSNKSVWWKCQFSHEWRSPISNRIKGNRCPKCSGNGTSLPEQGVSFYLDQICETEQRAKIAGNEIDVYLPDYKLGIEYDGRLFHTSEFREKEIEKDKRINESGIRVIRIKESDKNYVEGNIIYFKADYMGPNYEWALKQLFTLLTVLTGIEMFDSNNIDIKRDLLDIRKRLSLYYKEKSIPVVNPEVAKEWHPYKNGILKPDMFSAGSITSVWWLCSECGNEWKASINHRMISGTGCPICKRKRGLSSRDKNHLIEVGTLADNFPEIAKQWHPTRNRGLKPSDVSGGSNKKVWWICDKGHEWQAPVCNRTKGIGCAYCSGKRVFKGLNDLATVCPDIVREWHPTKNVTVKPTDVGRASKKKVWWLCSRCGHEWEAMIYKRCRYGTGCPKCAYERKRKGS